MLFRSRSAREHESVPWGNWWRRKEAWQGGRRHGWQEAWHGWWRRWRGKSRKRWGSVVAPTLVAVRSLVTLLAILEDAQLLVKCAANIAVPNRQHVQLEVLAYSVQLVLGIPVPGSVTDVFTQSTDDGAAIGEVAAVAQSPKNVPVLSHTL